MFHDESKEIARRTKDRLSGGSDHKATGGISREQQLVQAAAAMPVKLTDFVMYLPLDDLGVSFFMSTYVGEDPAVSQLYYLPKFYATTGYARKPDVRSSWAFSVHKRLTSSVNID
jgi:hypothetical protein